MAWTNTGIQQLVNNVGWDRINSMSLNNGKYLFIGYQTGVKPEDISFQTIAGNDVMVVHHTQEQGGVEISWNDYITTEFIENVDVMDEDSADYRIDPFILK